MKATVWMLAWLVVGFTVEAQVLDDQPGGTRDTLHFVDFTDGGGWSVQLVIQNVSLSPSPLDPHSPYRTLRLLT